MEAHKGKQDIFIVQVLITPTFVELNHIYPPIRLLSRPSISSNPSIKFDKTQAPPTLFIYIASYNTPDYQTTLHKSTMLHVRAAASSLREYLTPVSNTSTFRTTGEITPDEFVKAGDYLVEKFPTWSWASASKSKVRDFLPPDKQVLVTRHVPSHVRASTVSGPVTLGEEEDGWTSFGVANTKDADGDDTEEIAEIADSDFEELDDDDDDAAEAPATATDHRTYNLYIAYSTSYRVPKMFLSGYSPEGSPLTPEDMFEDIIPEYRDKTVTIERPTFQDNITMVAIHPCKHANVMRVLMERVEAKGDKDITRGVAKLGVADADDGEGEEEWEEVENSAMRVDQYLVTFLKFIASVTPGIEHDYTMSAL
ncbi:YALIA101S03e19394g1_1 [Yarrowia lipolytica]|nr:YALIA101S03e19394g1_1 [Yarrowia lipolytica]